VLFVQDRVRQGLEPGEPRVVVVEEQRAERVGPAEPEAGHIGHVHVVGIRQHVLVGEREVEPRIDEVGATGRRFFLDLRLFLGFVGLVGFRVFRWRVGGRLRGHDRRRTNERGNEQPAIHERLLSRKVV
jgi:hypothetical protein